MAIAYNIQNHMYNFKMFRCNSDTSKRINPETSTNSIRDNFSRDRDRIMYSKAFRRLEGKTQIFLAGNDDHARNRMTHTLEVSQIARTIAKALGLNEVLTEAIALGHDIGHTPFGHVGERTLNQIMSGCYEIHGYNSREIIKDYSGFKHNWQSIKVATLFTDNLNLTKETLWGMLNHSELTYSKCDYAKPEKDNINKDILYCNFRKDRVNIRTSQYKQPCNPAENNSLNYYINYLVSEDDILKQLNSILIPENIWSIEGYIVAIADEIAQRHHDIEDAIEYRIISRKDLLTKLSETFKCCITNNSEYYNQSGLNVTFATLNVANENQSNWNTLNNSINNCSKEDFLRYLSRFIVNLLTTDVIHNTANILNKFYSELKLNTESKFEDIRKNIFNNINWKNDLMSPEMYKYDLKLKKYLQSRILNSYEAQRMDGIGQFIIRELFKAYVVNPQQLPDKSIIYLFNNYYKLKYKDDCKKILEDNSLLINGNYNMGEMRNSLQNLHHSQDDNYYKIALLRTICDYIAGMTDKYAMDKHRELYNIKYE